MFSLHTPGASRFARGPFRAVVIATVLVAVLAATPALAQDGERQLGATNSSELGLVVTSGNSNTTSFNVRNLFAFNWEQADLDWEFGVLRASSGDDRIAVGSENDFDVIEPDIEPDSERIYTNLRYLRNINPQFFWYGRLFADRDQPADIDYRFTPSAGAGNTWVDRDGLKFLTGYGLSYTVEKLTLEGERNFAGYQLFYNLDLQATTSTSVESNMTFDGSLEDGSDFRFDWLNGVGVSISERIALKASVRLVYRNNPALEEIDLEDGAGTVIGEVVVTAKKLDSALTTSLVISF